MTLARIYVDGQNWEFMGEVTDKFLPFTNTLAASRSGRIYATSEAKPRMLTVEEIKVNPDEVEEIEAFLIECSTKRMNITVSLDADCASGEQEFIYLNCLLSGDPEHGMFARKISGFEVGYEDRIVKGI